MMQYSASRAKIIFKCFCEFYDLYWLPVGRLNTQKRNQVRV